MNIEYELNRTGAVIRGHHFVYTSGKHGPDFVRLDAVLSEPTLLEKFCGKLVSAFEDSKVQSVTACDERRCSLLARLCAKSLDIKAGTGEELRGRRTLVVEDVLTSGGSVVSLCNQARRYGASIVGVGVIWNRGSVDSEQLGVPQLEALTTVRLTAFEADQCDLCVGLVPIVDDVGQGSAFRITHPNYEGGFETIINS